MLPAKDRMIGLVGAIVSFGAAFVFGSIFVWIFYGTNVLKRDTYPYELTPACFFMVCWTSVAGFGWLRVRQGHLVAYRVLALFHTFLCIFTFVAANHILLVVLAPVAIFCEMRYQAIKVTNLDGGSTPANQ